MREFEIKGDMKQRCVLSPRLVCANEPCRIGEQPRKTLAVCHGTIGSIEVMEHKTDSFPRDIYIILYLGFALAFVACSVAGFERSWRMCSGYTQWRRWSVENANSGEVQREAASPWCFVSIVQRKLVNTTNTFGSKPTSCAIAATGDRFGFSPCGEGAGDFKS